MVNVEGVSQNEGVPELKIKEIDDCDFPIVEEEVNGYKVVELPASVRKYFDEEGYHALRINSTEVAKSLPDYGGETVSGHSIIPHQDHFPNDKRRFLALSQETDSERGASTFIAEPETVAKALPKILEYFQTNLGVLKETYIHNDSYQLSKEEIQECFEDGGLDRVVERKVGKDASEEDKRFAYCGILSYLIQGEHADHVVDIFLKENADAIESEDWKRSGTFIIDNARVFHGRAGGNENPLKRNWCI